MHTVFGYAAGHQVHQASGSFAGAVEVTAYIGKPSGILDIGI